MPFSIPRSALLWLTSGVVIEIFAYPRWSIFPLAYPVLAFYLNAIYQIKNIRQALTLGLLASMIGGFGAFTWVTYVLEEMAGFPLPVAIFVHTLFNLICLPNFICFFLLGFLLRNKVEAFPTFLKPIYWASLWVALEFLWRPFKIFPEMIGNTQWSWLEISQVASWGGVGAISFLVVYFGACCFYLWQDRKQKIHYLSLLSSISLILCAHFWGRARIALIENLPAEKIPIAMVQANIGNVDKMVAQSGSIQGLNNVLYQYNDLTALAASKKPELILWPETAYPLSFPTGPDYEAHFISRTQASHMLAEAANGNYSILFGGYERLQQTEFNSVILLGNQNDIQGSYKKNNLLIFGEYMPFANIWPSLKKLNPNLGDFGTGKGPFPLTWKRPGKRDILLGINICYESLIMPFMRDLARNGAQVFVNFSNDSWFGPGNEPYEHLELAAPRTIENGISMIRATNTGISAALDATGKVLVRGTLFTPQVVEAKVPIYTEPIETFYKNHGELFSWLLVVFSASLGIYAFQRNRKINSK